MSSRVTASVVSLAFLALASCDDDGGDGGAVPDASNPTPDVTTAPDTPDPTPDAQPDPGPAPDADAEPGTPDAEPVSCDRTGFTLKYTSFETEEDGTLVFAALDETAAPFDNLKLRFQPGAAPLEPGEIDLASLAPGGPVSMTLDADCETSGGQMGCEAAYQPVSGTLDLEAVPTPPSPEPYPSTTEHGQPVAPEPAQPGCVPEGTGALVGDNIADFELRNCYGEAVPFQDSCGSFDATWVMGVTAWCTACTELLDGLASQMTGEITPETLATFRPGVDLKIVLFENLQSGEPTLDQCMAYAEGRDLDPSLVYVDYGLPLRGTLRDVVLTSPDSDATWCIDELSFAGAVEAQQPLVDPVGYAVPVKGLATTYRYMDPYLKAEGGYVNTSTPWHAILRNANMEYVWSSYFRDSDWSTELNAVLSE
ncbi:MAG: hypothetical protein ACQEXJ_15770 [Myxococcota bacterium]